MWLCVCLTLTCKLQRRAGEMEKAQKLDLFNQTYWHAHNRPTLFWGLTRNLSSAPQKTLLNKSINCSPTMTSASKYYSISLQFSRDHFGTCWQKRMHGLPCNPSIKQGKRGSKEYSTLFMFHVISPMDAIAKWRCIHNLFLKSYMFIWWPFPSSVLRS